MASHDFPLGVNQLGLAQLNERSREIFRQIVESYLATGEPVGSRNLARILPMTLSPASVRNVMSDLEQLGLVYAPHTSAGRLPTEMGLRFFVDALMQIGDLTENDRRAIEAQVAGSGQAKSVEAVLTEASGLLSGLSRAAGVVLTAKSNPRLKHIEFVRLEPERALVILVAEDGQVENRVLNIAGRLADLGVDRSGEFPQCPHPRPRARRGQSRDRAHAQGKRGPTRSADQEDRRRRSRQLVGRGKRRAQADRARPGASARRSQGGRRSRARAAPCSTIWKPAAR